MQTWAILIPGLEVGDVGEARWPFGIVGDIHPTIRYASVHARLRCTGSACISWILDAEVLVHSTLAPDVTTDIQGAWVHIGKLFVTPNFSIWLLRPADGIFDRIWHWRFAIGKAYLLARLKVVAASKAPRVLVEILYALRGEIIRVGEGPTTVTILDVVRETRAISIFLWADYK